MIGTAPAKVSGGVTAPAGFRAAGVACGIKPAGLDLALLVCDSPAAVAAVFTTNRAQAAPVLISKDHVARSGGLCRAIVVNSGCANACTGEAGMVVAREMAAETARAVGCSAEQVLVASTGVIGVALDLEKVRRGIQSAAGSLRREAHGDAVRAIMTTDAFPKEHAVEVTAGSGTFRVGGMAKGAGMIEPRMATMLGFITTDAVVPSAMLQSALKEAVDDTFNAITVDGDCSTNDCVFALASGSSGVRVGAERRPDDSRFELVDGYAALIDGLRAVCGALARDIVRGGEGATKLITVHVTGAATPGDARLAARTIANSLLVKTAVHGGDPNWGRIVAAAGRSGAGFVLQKAAVQIGSIVLFAGGRPFDERAPQAAEYLKGRDITLEVNLGAGGSCDATVWTCDLSAEYVKINAEYRT